MPSGVRTRRVRALSTADGQFIIACSSPPVICHGCGGANGVGDRDEHAAITRHAAFTEKATPLFIVTGRSKTRAWHSDSVSRAEYVSTAMSNVSVVMLRARLRRARSRAVCADAPRFASG